MFGEHGPDRYPTFPRNQAQDLRLPYALRSLFAAAALLAGSPANTSSPKWREEGDRDEALHHHRSRYCSPLLCSMPTVGATRKRATPATGCMMPRQVVRSATGWSIYQRALPRQSSVYGFFTATARKTAIVFSASPLRRAPGPQRPICPTQVRASKLTGAAHLPMVRTPIQQTRAGYSLSPATIQTCSGFTVLLPISGTPGRRCRRMWAQAARCAMAASRT